MFAVPVIDILLPAFTEVTAPLELTGCHVGRLVDPVLVKTYPRFSIDRLTHFAERLLVMCHQLPCREIKLISPVPPLQPLPLHVKLTTEFIVGVPVIVIPVPPVLNLPFLLPLAKARWAKQKHHS